MKVALLQLSSSDCPQDNLETVLPLIRQAAAEGAGFVATPEVTNCVSNSRAHQRDVLRHEHEDSMLSAVRAVAAEQAIWVLIGSLALKSNDAEGRFVNRSFMIAPDGSIAARYDKLHMFDVKLSPTEQYRESDGYRPGTRAVLAKTSFGLVGMSICYDLRFPYLYRDLAQAGARILTVPSAFARPTGAAHWEVLLRARAIETGCFVIAPAQTGVHHISGTGGKTGKKTGHKTARARETHGHSMIVGPWGEVILDAGTDTGVFGATLEFCATDRARARIPSLLHDQDYNISS